MRVDKKKKLSSVAKELMTNPNQTVREVSKKTGVSKSTVSNYINEDLDKLGQKDDKIIVLTDKDFEMMQKIQNKKFIRLDDTDNPVDDNNLNQWDREAKARYTLFRGETTNEEGALNSFKDLSTNELLAKLNMNEQ